MQMFDSFLKSIPTKVRSEMVEELDIPDYTLSPYIWDPDDYLRTGLYDYEPRSLSTDSSLALSRAMTDSEIDYNRFRRYRSRSFSDEWSQLKTALDAFPDTYLDSVNSFKNYSKDEGYNTYPTTTYEYERRKYNDELCQKMKKLYDDCYAYLPDDPGLESLQDAIKDVDMKKIIASELENKP